MKRTTDQTHRIRMLIEEQNTHSDLTRIKKIEQLSDTIFLITWNDEHNSTTPIAINKMGVLKTFPYDMVYHSEFMQSVKSS